MISATPNSVRWDQVNRVSYRFQALNFQSDVLEALVLNSPPLSRRTRRKSIIRVAECTGNRVEFLQARSRERRSQSFDEEISDLAEHEAKLCEKLKLNHNRCVSKNDVTSSLRLDTRVEDGLGVEVQDEPKSNAEFLEERSESCVVSKGAEIECRCGKKDQLHDSGILYDRCDEDLESRSKEYLIQLVKELRSKLRDLSESQADSSKTSSVGEDIHHDCSKRHEVCSKCNRECSDNGSGELCLSSPASNVSFNYQDCMTGNMKQLESEVSRTRRIASMFQDELSGLKSKFSSLLGSSSSKEKRRPLTSLNVEERKEIEKCDTESTQRASDSNDNMLKMSIDKYRGVVEANYSKHVSTIPQVVLPVDSVTSELPPSHMAS